MEAIEHVGKAAVAAGKWAGTIARDADAYEHWRKVGYQYLATGTPAFLRGRGTTSRAAGSGRKRGA